MTRIVSKPLAMLAALVVFTAGCGGGGTDGTNAPGGGGATVGPDTAAAFCETLYGTFAQRWADCSQAPLAWASLYIDKAKLCANLVHAVDSGLAAYERNAAGRCLAFYESATCSDLRAMREDVKFVADCEAAVTGTLANAGATYVNCSSDYECASGRCYGAGADCPGICGAGYAVGTMCNYDRDCLTGAYCYSGSLWPSYTCQPYGNRPAENQACSPSVGCKPGLYCADYVSPIRLGTCEPQLTGGPCSGDPKAMAPGYGCFGGMVQPLLGPGASCSVTSDFCGPGLYCGTGAVCTQEPFVGEACVYYGGKYQGCIGGYCNGMNCVAEPITCYADLDCQSDGYCISGACESYCRAL